MRKSLTKFSSFLLLLFYCLPACAQQSHPFYDTPAKIQVAAVITLGSFDLAQSCYNVTHGGREDWLPTQSCEKLTGIFVAGFFVQESAAKIFHHYGHHKLERLVRFVSIGANSAGLIYSKQHGSF